MESIKELRKICQRPEDVDRTIFPRFFGRAVSIYLTWTFLHFKKITPNKITAAWAICYILGSFCYVRGEYWLNLVGISFILLFYLLDFTDGEVARYRKMVTRARATFFEPANHDFQYAILFPLLAVGVYRFSPDSTILVLGFSASLFKVLFRLLKSRYLRLKSMQSSKTPATKSSSSKGFVKKIYNNVYSNIASVHGIIPLLLIVTILDKVYLVVIFYGILFPAIYFVKLRQCIKKAKPDILAEEC